MDALAILKARHEVLDTLLHEMSCAVDRAAKREVLFDVARELAATLVLEKHAAGRAGETLSGWPEVDVDSYRLARIQRLVAELRSADVDELSFDAGFAELLEEVDCELDERETGLLPRLAAAFDVPGLHALGAELAVMNQGVV